MRFYLVFIENSNSKSLSYSLNYITSQLVLDNPLFMDQHGLVYDEYLWLLIELLYESDDLNVNPFITSYSALMCINIRFI